MHKLVLENIPCPIWIQHIDSTIIFLNKAYEKMFHVKAENIIGKTNREAFNEETAKIYNQQMNSCLESASVYIAEGIIDGVFVESYIFPLLDYKGEAQGVAGVIIDVHDRKDREIELENQKNILRIIIDAVPEAIFYKDKESKFIGYNKNFAEFYNKRGIEQIIGKTDLEIYGDEEVAAQFIEQDRAIMSQKEAKYFEYTIKDKEGNISTEENVKIPVIDDNGQVWGLVGLSRNITERKKLEKRLRYLSQTDMLTGLYNRYSFEKKIKELNYEQYLPLGIVMGDVNGLKLVNDTLGHLEGDRLLKDIARVLNEACDQKGFAFRWGGDEFIILLPNHNDSQCENVIGNILHECKMCDYKLIQLSIALGETVKFTLEEDIYECLKKVEEKVYRQKLLEKTSIKSSIMESLRKSLEEKNMETDEHTERVVMHALAIGKELEFKISDLDELALVGKLHDIGKIGIGEEILLKAGKLTDEEYEVMKTHAEKGYRIINASSELVNVAKCVLTHHERWDGNGYPLRLKGEEIPLMARIISIVDAYDVMTHDRVYKVAITHAAALIELRNGSGIQFDPKLVEHFIKYIQGIE
ncbi:MAG: PAS domain-containing protein [Cellulosilyticaceae bacterium]